jgi:hypothetical protein
LPFSRWINTQAGAILVDELTKNKAGTNRCLGEGTWVVPPLYVSWATLEKRKERPGLVVRNFQPRSGNEVRRRDHQSSSKWKARQVGEPGSLLPFMMGEVGWREGRSDLPWWSRAFLFKIGSHFGRCNPELPENGRYELSFLGWRLYAYTGRPDRRWPGW